MKTPRLKPFGVVMLAVGLGLIITALASFFTGDIGNREILLGTGFMVVVFTTYLID